MRPVEFAVTRRRVGPTELLRRRWIIDPDGLVKGSKHGRSSVWTPSNTIEVSREDGVCYVVHGGGDANDAAVAALAVPDPVVFVVLRDHVDMVVVVGLLRAFKRREGQRCIVLGPPVDGATCVPSGAVAHVVVEWDGSEPLIVISVEEP